MNRSLHFLVVAIAVISSFPRDLYAQSHFIKYEQTLGQTRTFTMAHGDLDGNGYQDILPANFLNQSHIWFNNGAAKGFKSQKLPSNYGTDHGVAIGDLNGDGFPDIYLVATADRNGKNMIFINDGHGTLAKRDGLYGNEKINYTEVYLVDVDNDGDLDAFIQTYLSSNELWLNDGNANFSNSGQIIGTDDSSSMGIADLNGDNHVDIFLTNLTEPEEVWLNDGRGKFSNTGQSLGNWDKYENVVLSDFDADGDLDAVVANSEHGLAVWLNNGNGMFKIARSYPSKVGQLSAGDFDNDGDIDVYSSQRKTGDILWLNDGKGNFSASNWIQEKSLTSLAIDIDNDGDLDLILGKGEEENGNAIYLNQTIK